MKVLITGSNGLIGTALKQALTAARINYDVVERSSKALSENETLSSASDEPTVYRINWPSGLSEIHYSDYTTVIHLALGPPDPQISPESAINEQLTPLRAITDSIRQQRANCSLLFMSSQSASADAISTYGQGKWACERLLRDSSIEWTIIRPGLVVSGSHKGLCGSILSLIKRSPIVPVPAGKAMQVQPVLLTDVITACLKILPHPSHYAGACYDLALPPRSLVSFTQDLCQSLHLKRLIVPVPWKFISGLLRISERLSIKLPVSRTNLEGLLASREMNSDAATTALTIELNRCLEHSLKPLPKNPLHTEAQYLFSSMFGFEAPAEVLARYVAAQREHLLNGVWINIDAIIRNRLDIDAIEFASRRKKTILSQKMQIMCYVAEQSPSLLPQFINVNTNRIRAFIELGIAGIMSGWKLLYGTYLLKKFELLAKERHD